MLSTITFDEQLVKPKIEATLGFCNALLLLSFVAKKAVIIRNAVQGVNDTGPVLARDELDSDPELSEVTSFAPAVRAPSPAQYPTLSPHDSPTHQILLR